MNPTFKTTLLVITSLPFIILARCYWQWNPGIWPCVLFWFIALADDPLRWYDMGPRRRVFYGGCFLGGLGNAVATISNGGFMPVLSKTDTTSLWVPLTAQSRVPWLCDIYAGASIGDFFIIAGLVAMLANWIGEKCELLPSETVAKGKRLPGLGIG